MLKIVVLILGTTLAGCALPPQRQLSAEESAKLRRCQYEAEIATTGVKYSRNQGASLLGETFAQMNLIQSCMAQ